MTIDSANIKTPAELSEYYTYSRTDNRSLNYSLQRNQLGKKKYAELTWYNLTPTDFAAIMAWADDLNSHVYGNTQSRFGTFTFTGLVTILTPGTYRRGIQYMTDSFSVGINEV